MEVKVSFFVLLSQVEEADLWDMAYMGQSEAGSIVTFGVFGSLANCSPLFVSCQEKGKVRGDRFWT